MDNEDLISILIAKKLSGQASAGELKQIEAWLQADAANEQEYEKIKKICSSMEDVLLPGSDFNTDNAWQKVAASLHANESKQPRSTRLLTSIFHKRIAVAAAAVVLFLIGLFVLNYNPANLKVITASNENLLIRLPDSSSVLLRMGSSLKYPAAFDAASRKVELSGEAFFDVQKDKARPFVIATANSTVRVLGTSFLVRSNSVIDEVVVVTGRVSVTDKRKSAVQVLLDAGRQVVLEGGVFRQTIVSDSNYLAWKSGLLDFKNASLFKVLEDLAHYYETPIQVQDEHNTTIGDMHITVRFERQSLETVLEEIGLITGLGIKKEGNKRVFYQK